MGPFLLSPGGHLKPVPPCLPQWVMVSFQGNNQGGDALEHSMRMTAPCCSARVLRASPKAFWSLSAASECSASCRTSCFGCAPWPILLEDQPLCPSRGLSFSPTATGSQPRLWGCSLTSLPQGSERQGGAGESEQVRRHILPHGAHLEPPSAS